jgi:ABC-type maltose transport system permease subunit
VLFGIITAGAGFLCMLPLICVLVPLVWAVGIVLQQAELAIVIEDARMLEGLQRGWSVFRRNIGPMFVIWLITGVIGVAIGLVLALPMLVVVLPTIIGFATSRGDLPTTALLVSGLCFVLYLPVMLAVGGIVSAYTQSVWTLTFLRLTRPGQDPGIPASIATNA